MKALGWVLLVALNTAVLHSREIPRQLWGTWRITRILPARTISCWGESDAKLLLGTDIRYTAHDLRWKSEEVEHPKISIKRFTAQQFQDAYSSPASDGSQVSFRDLGIQSNTVEEIDIEHPPANITGGTTEIPGDTILLKNHDAIILTVCNLYFKAHRVRSVGY